MKHSFIAPLASLLLVGCASPPPPRAAVAPPALPELPVPPSRPEPKLKKPEPPSVKATFHKLREAPDLRTSLLALIPVTGNTMEAFEERLTLALLDRGVGRVLPPEALLQVDSSLERPEAGTKGKVRLTAKLSSLALIAGASGADYALYGDVTVGSATGGGYEIPAGEMATYIQAFSAFSLAVDKAERETSTTCERATREQRERQSAPGADVVVAMRESIQFNQFQQTCMLRRAALSKLKTEVASPSTVQKAAREMPPPPGSGSTRVTATLKLRQSSNDETFWLGMFEAQATDTHAALQMVVDRLMQELTSAWPATPVPVEEKKDARGAVKHR